MKNNLGFARRLRALRSERGFSKSSLAQAVDVSPTCVWNWEEGNTYPRPGALAKVATVLGTTSASLGRGDASSSYETVSEDQSVDNELIAKARAVTGVQDKASLVREALKALIERESARRLARLGGSEPDLTAPPRRRSEQP
jgi:transcriptional regulator with XRE-family HTH domain